jgi:hypothetical protein
MANTETHGAIDPKYLADAIAKGREILRAGPVLSLHAHAGIALLVDAASRLQRATAAMDKVEDEQGYGYAADLAARIEYNASVRAPLTVEKVRYDRLSKAAKHLRGIAQNAIDELTTALEKTARQEGIVEEKVVNIVINGQPARTTTGTPLYHRELALLAGFEATMRCRVMYRSSRIHVWATLEEGQSLIPNEGCIVHVTASTPSIPFPRAGE